MTLKHKKVKTAFTTMKRTCKASQSKGVDMLICDEWLNNPSLFEDWAVSNGYLTKNAILNRKDVKQGFSPENCYIKTTPLLTVNGETFSYYEWSIKMGASPSFIDSLAKKSGEEAAIEAIKKHFDNPSASNFKKIAKTYTINGLTMSLAEWSVYLKYSPKHFSRCITKHGEEETVRRIKYSLETGKKFSEQRKIYITYNGITKSIEDWAICLSCSEAYLFHIRKEKGEDALLEFIDYEYNGKPRPTGYAKLNMITIDGKTQTAYKWAKEVDCAPNYISVLFNEKGMDAAIDFIKRRGAKEHSAFHQKHNVTVDGVTKTLSEWANIAGCRYGTLIDIKKDKGSDAAAEYIKYFLEHGHSPYSDKPIGHFITVGDETLNLKQWSEKIGVSAAYLSSKCSKDGEDHLVEFIKCRLENPSKFKRNKHQVISITVNGETKTISQWSKILGYCPVTFKKIVAEKGVDTLAKYIEDYLNTGKKLPIRSNNYVYIEIDGISRSVTDWSKEFGYSSGYFALIKSKKGIDGVIKIIKNKLNDGKEHTVRVTNGKSSVQK